MATSNSTPIYTTLTDVTGPKGGNRIPRNLQSPVEFIEALPSTPRARRIAPAEYRRVFETIDELLAHRRNDPARLLACLFVVRTGCRPVEAVRLRRSSANYDLGVITLDEHKTFRKTRKPKVFFITDEIKEILGRAEALHKLRGVDCEYVFPRRVKGQASNWLSVRNCVAS